MKNTCEVKSAPGKNTLCPSCSSFLKYLVSTQAAPYIRMPGVESVHVYCPLRDSLSSREGEVHSAEAGVAAITSSSGLGERGEVSPVQEGLLEEVFRSWGALEGE